jgi:hypothetical protein
MLVIALGVVLSLLWCWAGWYYLEQSIGFENLMLFLPHEIGQFAVGFFTPLFLLWILIVLVTLVRRVGRLAEGTGGSGGGRERDPQLESAAAAAPKRESPKSEPAAKADGDRAAPAKRSKASEKKTPKAVPTGRATASASVTSIDESGKVTLKKVEESTVSGEGPVTAVARAVGRTVKGDAPPKRPAKDAGGELPPKRPDGAAPPEEIAAEETPPRSPPGPFPPKRPPEENVETLPRTAEGPRPPKSPKAIVESYAEAQGHTVKELNAIAMDTAALICDHDDYRASREALNDGRDDSFFELVAETLEQDGAAAAGRLRDGGNRELLEAYCSKFRSLLQAAEQEPEADSLVRHLKNSAPGRLYTTIESKL